MILYPVDSVSLMASLTVKPSAKASTTKKKRGRSANAKGGNKHAKRNWGFDFYLVFDPVSISSKRSILGHMTFYRLQLFSALFFNSSIFQFFLLSLN